MEIQFPEESGFNQFETFEMKSKFSSETYLVERPFRWFRSAIVQRRTSKCCQCLSATFLSFTKLWTLATVWGSKFELQTLWVQPAGRMHRAELWKNFKWKKGVSERGKGVKRCWTQLAKSVKNASRSGALGAERSLVKRSWSWHWRAFDWDPPSLSGQGSRH